MSCILHDLMGKFYFHFCMFVFIAIQIQKNMIVREKYIAWNTFKTEKSNHEKYGLRHLIF